MIAFTPVFDPFLAEIDEYRRQLAAFNAYPDVEDDQRNLLAERTYAPPLQRLEEWTEPARWPRWSWLEDPEPVCTMIGAALAYFRGEGQAPAGPATDIDMAFTSALGAMTGHERMWQMHETLSHLSDTISTLQCRPWFAEAPESDDALQALDNFLLVQIEAIRAKALATEPVTRRDWEA